MVQDIAECEFVDNLTVKGVHYPIEVYKLIRLREEGERATKLLQTDKQSFVLKELNFDYPTSGAKEREEMKKVLHTALGIIERAEKAEAAS